MSERRRWATQIARSLDDVEEFTCWPRTDSLDALVRARSPSPEWQVRRGDADEIHEIFQVALKAVVGVAACDATSWLQRIFYVCESPPEHALLAALIATARGHGDGVVVKAPDLAPFEVGDSGMTRLTIELQKRIGDYRVDFLLTSEWREPPVGAASLVVECDGHDFHERTKQQASRDRRRDRALQALGFRVFRFTGSDIWRDAAHCAYDATVEVAHAAYQKHRELREAQ